MLGKDMSFKYIKSQSAYASVITLKPAANKREATNIRIRSTFQPLRFQFK
jgi:hypothetical protein